MTDEPGEVRLVAMVVAGTYAKGGLKLRTACGNAREAWEHGIDPTALERVERENEMLEHQLSEALSAQRNAGE